MNKEKPCPRGPHIWVGKTDSRPVATYIGDKCHVETRGKKNNDPGPGDGEEMTTQPGRPRATLI